MISWKNGPYPVDYKGLGKEWKKLKRYLDSSMQTWLWKRKNICTTNIKNKKGEVNKVTIKASEIDSKILLLIGKDSEDNWGTVTDRMNKTVRCRNFGKFSVSAVWN